MPLTRWGEVAYATDQSMATITNNSSSRFRAALIELLELVAAGVIADDSTVAAAASAAVENALAAGQYTPQKCIHLENGVWVWDGPSGLGATHYLIPDDTGVLVARPTVWPVPASTPVLNW